VGPIALFDKSFLQSLTVDESVWFDHFFLTNVCPLFYVETLADLGKSYRTGQTADREVGIIASKFPEMHGSPSVFHLDLCIANLLGYPTPMTGQIPLAHARPVRLDGKFGLVAEASPEASDFSRWQKEDFRSFERIYARAWRDALAGLNLKDFATRLKAFGIDGKSCKSIETARSLAQDVVSASDRSNDRLILALEFLGIPVVYHRPILDRWDAAGAPNLADLAPYANFVLTIDVFFAIALASNLLGASRKSNRTDIAYLYYLPFCMVFVSTDRLHSKCAPLFLRQDQEFVWGQALKADLGRLNSHYLAFPQEVKEEGVMMFADAPPRDSSFLVTGLWDRLLPKRSQDGDEDRSINDSRKPKPTADEIMRLFEAPTFDPVDEGLGFLDVSQVGLRRTFRSRKGSWLQMPSTVADSGPEHAADAQK
jgi:hypothetical protein